MSVYSPRGSLGFALVLCFALAPSAGAQFSPTVVTSFGSTDADTTATLQQVVTLAANQTSPERLTIRLDRGSLELAGLAIGDVVGTVTPSVVVPGMPPLFFSVSGSLNAEVRVVENFGDSITAETVVTGGTAALLVLFPIFGQPSPLGSTVLTHVFTDLPEDGGVIIETFDNGALPSSASTLNVFTPIDVLLPAIYRQSPGQGAVTVDTVLVATDGTTVTNTESFPIVGGSPSFQRGDVNASGAHELLDAILVLSYLFASGPSPSCLSAADADDNGVLSIADAINVLSLLFVAGSAIPAPFGDCGFDPTPDSLSCAQFAACP